MNKTNKLRNHLIFPLIFLIAAAIGLYLIKWSPYYAKAFIAAAKGSIGSSPSWIRPYRIPFSLL